MAESLHCSPETIIILLTSYTKVQNKSLKEKEKKEISPKQIKIHMKHFKNVPLRIIYSNKILETS